MRKPRIDRLLSPFRVATVFAWSALMLTVIALAALARPGDRLYYRIAMVWCRGILRVFGVTYSVEGTEHFEPGRDYVVLANHRSHLDPPIMALGSPGIETRWVAKKELKDVPIFGRTLVVTGQIFIDRKDPAAAVAELNDHERDRGVSVCFFPEGRRNPDNRLMPFKKGGAAFAINAGLPVLPMAISGSERCLAARSLTARPGHVRVKIGAPIATDGLTYDDRDALTERVRAEIARLLEELEGPGSQSAASNPDPGTHV